jgi:hypothetical protein
MGAWPSNFQTPVLPDIWESIPQKMKTPEGLGADAPKPSGFGGLVIKKKPPAAGMTTPGRGKCS